MSLDPVLRPAGDVPPLDVGPSVQVRFVAPGSMTDGRFGLFRWDMAPNAGGPAPHVHDSFSESFYVLAGTVQVYDGHRWADATAGDFLFVPDGAVHAFRNATDEPASMLILFAPGAPRERYFEELAEMAREGRTLSPDELTEFYARHGQRMV
jgi:mannose-6-phosphate isomerase-like protein (cupin superfamily)